MSLWLTDEVSTEKHWIDSRMLNHTSLRKAWYPGSCLSMTLFIAHSVLEGVWDLSRTTLHSGSYLFYSIVFRFQCFQLLFSFVFFLTVCFRYAHLFAVHMPRWFCLLWRHEAGSCTTSAQRHHSLLRSLQQNHQDQQVRLRLHEYVSCLNEN